MSDPSSQPTQPLTEREWERLGELVAGGHFDNEYRAVKGLYEAVMRERAEVSRLRAENTALREARDGECPRCRFPVWSHDLWKCIPWDMDKHVGDDELRREVVLRELNQGALAGMSSEVTDQAADLVLAALNRYDAWRAEPDPRALGLDQDGSKGDV